MLRSGFALCIALAGVAASSALFAQQFGRTPLMEAALSGQIDTVRALAKSGADLNATDMWGDTALLQVTQQGSWPAVLEALVELGANVDRPNRIGRTPLMNAAAGTSPNHQRMLEALLQRGASVNRRDDLGLTALYHGTGTGIEARARTLLAAGADVNIATRDGDTPLMAAAAKGSATLIQLLLAAGASPNAANKRGMVALMQAAFYNNEPAMTALLQAGADPNARQTDGASVLTAAVNPGNVRAVDILLAWKADPNARLTDGRTVLMLAAPSPNNQIIGKLLAAGADPNLSDQYDQTPLMQLGLGQRESPQTVAQAAKLLAGAGANVNWRGRKSGQSALLVACITGQSLLALTLLDLGADPHVRNTDRDTPLSWARRRGMTDVVDRLVKAGATE